MSADRLEQAVIGKSLDLVLMPTYLREVLERLREARIEEQSGKELAEARGPMRELDRTINGLVDAVEQRASGVLMNRLVERERERDDTLAQLAQTEAELRYRQDQQVDSASESIMVAELRRGVKAGHATARDTLQRFGSKIEVKGDRGTLYLRIPPSAILSVSTPGAVRTAGSHCALPFEL